jgi:hypothetical protein
MQRWTTITAFAALSGAALSTLSGCGGGAEEEKNPLFADVIFEGGADSDALEALLAVETKDDPAHGAAIDSPPTAIVLSAAQVTPFTWHPRDGAPTAPGAPPLNGAGYFLLFSTDATPRLLRVFTTKTSYTPSASAWATLASAKTWTTLDIFAASFVDDALAPGGGPFKGTSIAFCIEP